MIEKGYYFESPVQELAVTQLINPFDKQGEQAHEAYKQIAIDSANPGIPERMLKGDEVTTSFSSFNGKQTAHICTVCYAETINYNGKECCPNRCWGWGDPKQVVIDSAKTNAAELAGPQSIQDGYSFNPDGDKIKHTPQFYICGRCGSPIVTYSDGSKHCKCTGCAGV